MMLLAFTPIAMGFTQNNNPKVIAQAYTREQVLRAYYMSGGKLNMLKIKIAGNKVIQYSTEKNNGQDFWLSAGNADILCEPNINMMVN